MTTVTTDADIDLRDICDEYLIEEIESRGLLVETHESRIWHLIDVCQYRQAAQEALEAIENRAGKEGALTKYLVAE